ncbi:MAG: OmpH family outer membrane protein [Luteolibacter sp.]
MNFKSWVAAFWVALAGILHAESQKIATVDLQVLFKAYHRTAVEQRGLSMEQARIQKDDKERLANIRELKESFEKILKQLDDPSISDSKKQSLLREGQAKQQEGIALERERNDFIQRKSHALEERRLQRMRLVLTEIQKIVETEAKEEDYDYIFDRSGLGMGTGMPIMLYCKDSTDITALILKNLNKDAPAETLTGKDAEPTVKAQDK